LFIHNIDPELKRLIAELATKSGRGKSNEAAALIRDAICRDPRLGFGTRLFNLVDSRDRGEDLVFEINNPVRPPPDFE
jgi:hypothetical protein